MAFDAVEVRAFAVLTFRRLERWQAFVWGLPLAPGRRHAWASTPIPRSRLSRAQRVQAGRLRARGATASEIARSVDAERVDVSRWLNERAT